MRSSAFLDFTQRRAVASHRRFGTTYRPNVYAISRPIPRKIPQYFVLLFDRVIVEKLCFVFFVFFVLFSLCFCIVSFMYIYSYLLLL